MKQNTFCLGTTIAVLIFLYLPILILTIYSFNDSRFGGEWSGFTLKWYEKLIDDTELWEAASNSFLIAISATVVSTILGTSAAFALHQYSSKLQKVHYALIYTPLIMPDILMGISLLLFFIAFNIQLGLFTIFLAHTTFCISYVTMVMRSKLQHFDFTLLEAAQDLGASQWVIIRRIFLPLLMPGLAAAGLLAFMLSIDDFVITYFVAGHGVSTLPIYIYGMMKFGSTPIVNALSVIILAVTFVLIIASHRLSKDY
jgi:spermidine/putrescine transport system permease protein